MSVVSDAYDRSSLMRHAWRQILRAKLELLDRRAYRRLVIEYIDGLPFVVPPDVFNPRLLRSGEFLVQTLARSQLIPTRSRVLDLGCGSGVCGIWAATRRRCEVVCTDINASAVRCTRANALLNNVEVEVRHGDLFEPVADEQFDVVVFNPPYYRGTPRDALDHAWRAPDVAERFAAELARHLTSGGSAAVVLSSDGDAGFPTAIAASSLAVEIVARRDLINEIQTVYQLRPC